MKKILITGATGFVGSHLTELCVARGLEVVAFDRYNPNYNLGWLENSNIRTILTSNLAILDIMIPF